MTVDHWVIDPELCLRWLGEILHQILVYGPRPSREDLPHTSWVPPLLLQPILGKNWTLKEVKKKKKFQRLKSAQQKAGKQDTAVLKEQFSKSALTRTVTMGPAPEQSNRNWDSHVLHPRRTNHHQKEKQLSWNHYSESAGAGNDPRENLR